MNNNKTYCGFITIVGRSNVGKSTILNRLLGQKISITSRKAGTTRYQIFGVHTKNKYQVIYIDTPGINVKKKYIINNLINKSINNLSINKTKLIIFVVDSIYWTLNDEMILNELRKNKLSVILVVNKIDNIQKKTDLLPHLKFLANKMHFLDIVPISAKKKINIDLITSVVHKYLPEAVHHFPERFITNCSQQLMASEIIREKLIRFLGAEVPYSINVKIERFQNNKYYKCNNYYINGLIFVKHKGQKKIVIGNKGAKIKTISIEARRDMQRIFKVPVHLRLWVKIKSIANNSI